MGRIFVAMLFCASALGGCASSGGLPSVATIGGPAEPEKPAKPAEASAPAAASEEKSGIWSNFSSMFSSGAQPAAQKPPEKPAFDADEALKLVNEYRAQKHLHPLTLDPRASEAAAILAADMAKHDHMSHLGPEGADMARRLTTAGYPYKIAAENVGVGQASLSDVVEGWKKSPPHSRNMLLPKAKHLGIAYQYSPNTKYKNFWALVVASP